MLKSLQAAAVSGAYSPADIETSYVTGQWCQESFFDVLEAHVVERGDITPKLTA
jgi:hypothetical protein